MRVALYARVSTRDRDQNPETQLLPLREWATREGHDAAEYVDEASATDFRRRTAWADLLDASQRGRVKAVAVLRLDRAFRSSSELHRTLEVWRTAGVDFISLREAFDTTTATGRLMLGLLGSLAEFERELIRERVIDGMNRAQAEGKHVGRPRGGLTVEDAAAAVEEHGSVKAAAAALGVSRWAIRDRLGGGGKGGPVATIGNPPKTGVAERKSL